MAFVESPQPQPTREIQFLGDLGATLSLQHAVPLAGLDGPEFGDRVEHFRRRAATGPR
jgi:hypothetical protein